MRKLLILVVCFLFGSNALAQPPHSCGTITSLSVMFDRVDAAGYAPRFKEGNQTQFDCIAARDTYFNSQRFNNSASALNYWLGLFGQELGVNMGLLPN